jgi:hypothetical protein
MMIRSRLVRPGALRVVALALGCALGAVGTAPAATPPNLQLQALARDMTFRWAGLHPLYATALGIPGEDGFLNAPSTSAEGRDLALIRDWEARLATIPVAGQPRPVSDDAVLLRAQLMGMEREFTVYHTDRRDYSAPGTAVLGALFTQFEHLPATGGRRAWNDIIARLSLTPAYLTAAEALVTEPGRLQGVVGAQELAGAPDFLAGALTAAAKAQLAPAEFVRFGAARDAALGALAREKAYIDAHAAGWPRISRWAAARTTRCCATSSSCPYDAAAVESMGADELAHGWVQTYWLEHEARERGAPIGAATGGGLAPGGAALVPYYRARIAQLRRFVATHHVIDVPPWLGRIEVVETPKFLQPVSPGAAMNSPRLFATETAGFYYITPPVSLADAARRLDPNEDFDRDRILSTAAHEAMPGHFLQLSIARRQPDFVRRIQFSSSFAEGWAYYGEEMFVALGLYGDDLDARYFTAQWERVRGARAIVDAKLASGEMTEPQAATYFAAQTGFGASAAKAAVDGIALGPGYVIAYTVGRQQLELLEHDYFAAAGKRASLADFHDRLMCYGTTPLSVVAPELLADLTKSLAAVRAAADAQP